MKQPALRTYSSKLFREIQILICIEKNNIDLALPSASLAGLGLKPREMGHKDDVFCKSQNVIVSDANEYATKHLWALQRPGWQPGVPRNAGMATRERGATDRHCRQCAPE